MKDIFEKYKKVNFFRNLWIVTASLVIALWINFFVLDSNIWKSLTANIIWTSWKIKNWDIYLINNNWNIWLKTNKDMRNIKSFSLSFYYNPENVNLLNINSSLSQTSITNIENEEWLNTILINFDDYITIEKNTEILKLKISKKENKTEFLNIWNANFKDMNWKVYLLSPESDFLF